MKIMNLLVKSICFSLIIVMSVALWGCAYTQWHIQDAEKKYPALGEFVQMEGQQMHYLQAGRGSRTIVLLHGAHGSTYDYKLSIFNELAEKNKVIAIDRPGFGYSTRNLKKAFTLEDQAQKVNVVIEKLDLDSIILVGHSLGAALALRYVATYPDRVSEVVLLSPYVVPYNGDVHWMHHIPTTPVVGTIFMRTLFVPIVKTFFIDKATEKVFDPNEVDPDYAEVVKALSLRPDAYRANAEDIRLFGPALKRLQTNLGDIKVPVTVFHGEKDKIASFTEHQIYLKQHIQNLNFISLEATGHQPLFSRTRDILDFFEYR